MNRKFGKSKTDDLIARSPDILFDVEEHVDKVIDLAIN